MIIHQMGYVGRSFAPPMCPLQLGQVVA